MNVQMKKLEMFRCRDLRRAETGASALIVVLWVVCLLSIMLSSFTFDAHVEAKITSYYRKRTKADWLARSGMEVATLLMAKRDEVKGILDKDKDPEDRWFEPAKRLSEGLAIRGLKEELGDGEIELDIVPEPARRNVNLLKDDDWERMLEVSGVPEEMWDELIDCVLDWIDKDEAVRLKGAETEDYYSRLDRPYKAKNGPLDAVGELLLVKGFNRAILYGGTIKIGSEAGSIFADDKEEPIDVTGIDDMLTT
jgi:general secretion pathway protein K